MSAVALLYSVALVAAESGRDVSTTARELVQTVGASAADVEAVGAAVLAINHGRPVRTVASELAQVLRADVDALAAQVFTTYALPRTGRVKAEFRGPESNVLTSSGRINPPDSNPLCGEPESNVIGSSPLMACP
jgi:hypothetical protein